MSPIRIPRETMLTLTQEEQERNIYVHPHPVARDIFWQRLEILSEGLSQFTNAKQSVIDFGGGSGGFLRGLCNLYDNIEVIDLDPDDAQAIQAHYKLDNAKIIKADITQWMPEEPRDIVIATDVLEHFEDMDMPIKRIHEYLTPTGMLAISVPSENWIYRLGRIVVRKTKPKDHYHAGADIIERIQELGFKLIWQENAPQYAKHSIPLFNLAIFQKEE